MRKIFNLWIFAVAVLLVAACTPEVDDKFDSSSAQRAAASQAETQKILESQNNGWIMHMYGTLDFGGFNVYCNFKDSKVTVASEFYGPDETATSHYKLEQSSGTVLSFDEYNPIFHYFSDPSNTDFGSLGKGFNGDLEFRVLSATADSVILQGKKHGNRIVMTPLKEGTWANYYNEVNTTVENMQGNDFYAVVVDKDTITATMDMNRLTVIDPESGESTDMPFTVTPAGFEFYQPVSFRGKTITGFVYSDDKNWKNPADNSVSLVPIVPPVNQQLIYRPWYVTYSNLGAFGQAYWDAFPHADNLKYAIFGYFKYYDEYGSNFGLHANQGIGKNYYWGTFGFDYKLIGNDELELTFNAKKDVLNGDYFLSKMNFAYVVYPFAWGKTTRRFKVETDNINHPTLMTLTDEDNPENVIKMTRAVKQWPYKN